MPSAYSLLPSTSHEIEKPSGRRALVFPRIPWNSRVKLYSLAMFIGVFFQLFYLLAFPRVLSKRNGHLECSDVNAGELR
jgi:hypothetical protein